MITFVRWKSAAVLLALAALFAAACGGGSTTSPTPTAPPAASATARASFPVTVPESDGQKLTLNAAPQRIVSLSANVTDILCAIGAGGQLVAVDKFANCPAGSTAKPALDAYQPNLEAIVAYKPDLVYVSSDSANIVASLRNAGTPVLYLTLPESLAATLDQVRLFGQLSGHAAEAASLAGGLQKRIDGVKQALSGVTTGPKVYHELDTTYYSAAPSSFVGDFYTILKAQNIASGAKDAYPQLSSEVIVQRNPDVIVLADEGPGVSAASVSARPGWSAITAVKDKRICGIDPSLVSQPGPRIADALETLAKCLYPDRFK